MVNDIKTQIPQAYDAVGSGPFGQNYDAWAAGQEGSSEHDREFAIYQAEGLSQHLKNVILCYLNLPSVGYSDFSDNKKVEGDQYRGYIARAKAVYDAEVAELGVLQASGASSFVISLQMSTITSALSNWKQWIVTYNTAITSKQIV
jgi:hypothetical protein